jgi:hypothetical protein
MAKGFIACARYDAAMQNEVSRWPDGFTIHLQVLSEEPYVSLRKDITGLHIIRANHRSGNEVILFFKNIAVAREAFSGKISIGQAFIEERLSVKGNSAYQLSVVRSMIFAQSILFPGMISKGKPKKRIRRYLRRLKIYAQIFISGKSGEGMVSNDPEILRVFE